jgi:hypothetical protein
VSISGTWVRNSQPVQPAPLVSDRDPEHANPTPDPNQVGGARPSWEQTVTAPDLPAQLYPGQEYPLVGGGGPVDRTPVDHSYGVGIGPVADATLPFHATDMGEVAAHHYTAPKMRDGQAGVLIIEDMHGDGDSPQTLPNQRMGVGEPADPAARRASMIRRFWDRFIDMHRYDVQFRPETASQIRARVASNAGPAASSAVPNTPSILGYDPSSPDRFVGPFTRRAPGPWDDALATDGTGQAQQDLGSWGL